MSDHDTWNMFAARIIGGLFSKHGCGPTEHNMIEMAALAADALLAESKKREPSTPRQPSVSESWDTNNLSHPVPTPPQPDDDGWIKWEGGECQVPPATLVYVKLRNGIVSMVPVGDRLVDWAWSNSAFDVTAYRIVSEAGVAK